MLLRPFMSRNPATLKDRAGCTYVLPSYAEPIAQDIFTFGTYESGTQKILLEFLSESGILLDIGLTLGC